MKKIVAMILMMGIGALVYQLINDRPEEVPSTVTDVDHPAEETVATEDLSDVRDRRTMSEWNGASEEEVLSEWGAPDRKDTSGYGYDWWVYEGEKLFQLGIQDGEVVTSVWMDTPSKDSLFQIGDPYENIVQSYDFNSDIQLKSEGAFTMELTDQDLKERPLVPLDERWTAQLYFDMVTERLSAVRIIRNDILLKMQPYRVVYRGRLPLEENLDRDDWKRIEDGLEKQILMMTNHIRIQHDLKTLELHKKASAVAYLHSKDMNENNYFSHYSQNGDGLKDRLGEIGYVQAGENIAAQYIDATAAIHGWMNSSGHRKALLEPSYTHIGIGVHQRYYTQNFLSIP